MSFTLHAAIGELKDKLKPFLCSDPPAFTDEELGRALDRGVRVFSRHRPYITSVDFNLVANTHEYDWPAQATEILPFAFSNSTEAPSLPPLDPALFDFESPALDVRAKTYLAQYRKALMGKVSPDKATRKLTVFPVPSANQTVKLPIQTTYPKTGSAGSEAYATIPDYEMEYIVLAAYADCLRILATAFSANNKKIGDTDYRGSFTARDLVSMAEDAEARFEAHFPKVAGGRS